MGGYRGIPLVYNVFKAGAVRNYVSQTHQLEAWAPASVLLLILGPSQPEPHPVRFSPSSLITDPRQQYVQLRKLHFKPTVQVGVASEMEILDGIFAEALQSELTWFGDRYPSPLCPPSHHGWNDSNPLEPLRQH